MLVTLPRPQRLLIGEQAGNWFLPIVSVSQHRGAPKCVVSVWFPLKYRVKSFTAQPLMRRAYRKRRKRNARKETDTGQKMCLDFWCASCFIAVKQIVLRTNALRSSSLKES